MSTKHDLNDKFAVFIFGLGIVAGIATQSLAVGVGVTVALAIMCQSLRILR